MLTSIDNAITIILDHKVEIVSEAVTLPDALGRVLATDIVADEAIPPFDKSAMDGFAIRESDLLNPLNVIGTAAAGQVFTEAVGPNQAVRIMTGAPLPHGANFVVELELSETLSDGIIRLSKPKKNNIIYKGSQAQAGDVLIAKGTVIEPHHIAIMASVGVANPVVAQKPVVGIVSTGSELVEPHLTPAPGQIRNSNGWQIMAQVIKWGGNPKYYGIVADDYQLTFNMIETALRECDMIVVSGGASFGDFDFVPQIFEKLGIGLKIKQLNVQPGKPLVYGTLGKKPAFGLPGNPVSAYVQFMLLVSKAIQNLMGATPNLNPLRMPLAQDYAIKNAAKEQYVPIKIGPDGWLYLTNYKGSSHISALAGCHGFMKIPTGTQALNKGDLVDVRLF